MKAQTRVENRLTYRFTSGAEDCEQLIDARHELTSDSSTRLSGYGAAQRSGNRREDSIPYFHILVQKSDGAVLRVLALGGWQGTEFFSTYLLRCFVIVLELPGSRRLSNTLFK